MKVINRSNFRKTLGSVLFESLPLCWEVCIFKQNRKGHISHMHDITGYFFTFHDFNRARNFTETLRRTKRLFTYST